QRKSDRAGDTILACPIASAFGHARNRVDDFPIRRIFEAIEKDPFPLSPARVIPARQQSQILLPFPQCALCSCLKLKFQSRKQFPQLPVERYRLAFGDLETELPRIQPFAAADEP